MRPQDGDIHTQADPLASKCCVLRKYILLAVLLIIKLINVQNSDNCHSVSESAVQRELNGHTRVADTLLVRVKANLSKLTFFFLLNLYLGFVGCLNFVRVLGNTISSQHLQH